MAGQRSGKQLIQILCVLCVLALSAFTCDNGSKESLGVPGNHPNHQPNEPATVGADACTFCHPNQTNNWMTGAHGNMEAINHATHAEIDLGMENDGFPYYGYLSDASCAACHDPLGDGRNLMTDLTGNVDRPVVGCESCHGGGAEHFGVGEIPHPKPGDQECAQCHSSVFPDSHRTYHPEGDDIAEEFATSPHAVSLGSHQLDGVTGDVRARCSRCHSDEGFRKFQALVPGTTGRLDFRAFFTDPVSGAVLQPNLPVADTNSITCRTCHEAHTASKDQLEGVDEELIAGVTNSPQFNTCTQCHQLSGLDGNVMLGSTVGTYHYSDDAENIADTHAAVPGDTRYNGYDVVGGTPTALWFVDKRDPDACAKCHNPHSADLSINEQYARSGHGNPLAVPWAEEKFGTSCQRCHTTAGYVNFATSEATDTTYNSANNDFSEFLPANGGRANQYQSIYCWGCHKDYKGGLRNPGQFPGTVPTSTSYTPPRAMDGTTAFQYPNLNGSNVCLACHSGRESGGNIVKKAIDGVTDFNNLSQIRPHYRPAAELMFVGQAYLFAGATYDNVSYYEHDVLGLGGLGSTIDAAAGTNGPCVACHMSSNPEKHLFLPIEYVKVGDTVTEEIASISSNLCATCHAGTHELTVADLNEQKELMAASVEGLKYFASLNGCFYDGSRCYTDGTYLTQQKDYSTDLSTRGLGDGPNNMGAAINLFLLSHDTGAYVHNRIYAKRLLYDSIDWYDDKVLNHSVQTTLLALDPLVQTWRDDAIAYILTSSGGRP